jgi:hypothetical protein
MTGDGATFDQQLTDEPRAHFLVRLVDWLRAGYPAGVPRQDYVALLGLLQRKLTETEVRQIAIQLTASTDSDKPISRDDIETMISQSVLQPAADHDVARVSAHLASGGWPLADPPLA